MPTKKSQKRNLYKKDKDIKPDNSNSKKIKKGDYVSPLKDYVYENNGLKKVVAYIRVSTKSESQAKSLNDNQPALIEKMIKSNKYKDTHELIATFAEWYTGTTINRPVFIKLLEEAKISIESALIKKYLVPGDDTKMVEGYRLEMLPLDGSSKYDEIWVKSTSRFSRSIQIQPVLEMLKDERAVIVRFLDIDMDTEKNSAAEIAKRIIADMEYSESLSRNIKASKEMAIEKGENPLHDTFGYFHEPVSKTSTSKLIENPEEADIVRFIYDVYLNGFEGKEYSSGELIKLLTMDIPELGKKPMLTRKNKPFAKSTINRILRNETYTGHKKHGKYSKDDNYSIFDMYSKQTVNLDIEMERDERVDIIIDMDTWKKVQKELDKTAEEFKKQGKPIHKSKKLYAPYLRCGYCGSNFRFDNNKGDSFYTCALKDEKGISACQVNNIYTTQLDNFITRYAKTDFNEIFKIDVENQLNTLINHTENLMFDMDDSGNLMDYEKINKKKKFAEEKLTALVLDSEENMDISTIQSLITNLKQTIIDYNKQLKDMTTPAIKKVDIIENAFTSINSIIHHYDNLPKTYTKEDILDKLDKIVVHGIRNINSSKRGNPILIPYFKLSTSSGVQDFIDTLDIEIPSYSYALMSGIEYFDRIETFIDDEKLNTELKDYLQDFKTIQEAQEYSKTDKYASENLKTYIFHFDTLEEALAEEKLSPYDKDLRQKDLIKPYVSDIPIVQLNFNMEDLNRRYGETVLTFNDRGEQVENVGYLYNMGVDNSDTMDAIRNKLSTLQSAFDNLKRQYKK